MSVLSLLVPVITILTSILTMQKLKSASEQYQGLDDMHISNDPRLSEDGRLSFLGLAAKYTNHTVEKIYITTEDGYILNLYHIKGDTSRPVLLVHGNTAASTCWALRGNDSLAFILAHQGYDVWALDTRSSSYPRKHVTIDPIKEPERFFNFSFYEQGYYDLPAAIDYVLKETNQPQLLAVGHSVGTTVFYVLGAERPEYNDKIKTVLSLAPICYLKHVRGYAEIGITFGDVIVPLFKNLGIVEVVGRDQFSTFLFHESCLGPAGYETCVEGIIFPLFGFDKEGLEREFIPTLTGHLPEGSSVKTFEHLLQVSKKDKFAQFDYGEEGNVVAYGRTEPPEIDLSKVTMKVALVVGKEDYLSSVQDTDRLSKELPNVVYHQVLPYDRFNHLDFVFGKNMNKNLYPYILDFIEKYSSNIIRTDRKRIRLIKNTNCND